jgi:hypothetical protein
MLLKYKSPLMDFRAGHAFWYSYSGHRSFIPCRVWSPVVRSLGRAFCLDRHWFPWAVDLDLETSDNDKDDE